MKPKFQIGEYVVCIRSNTGRIQDKMGLIESITESGNYVISFKINGSDFTPCIAGDRLRKLTKLEQALL